MDDGFESWVRVLCAGPLAFAAWTAYTIPNLLLAGGCGMFAIIFAIWPERAAYAYRKNWFVPFWSKPISIVNPDAAGNEPVDETLETCRPKLWSLFSAYVSLNTSVILAFSPLRIPVMRVPYLVIAGAAILLGLLARTEN